MSTFEPRYKDLVSLLNSSVEKFAGRVLGMAWTTLAR